MASRNRGREDEYQVNPNAWMFTLSDLICLLLTFFVMLLTMKSMDTGRVRKFFFETIGPMEYVGGEKPAAGEHPEGCRKHPSLPPGKALEAIMDLLAGGDAAGNRFPREEMRSLLEISEDQRGVVVTLSSDQLFDPGEDRIRPDQLGILDAVAQVFRYAQNDILIMGHTDAVPVREGRFASNWELSFRRALSVLDYLRDTGKLSPEHLAAGGFGDTQQVYPDDTDEHRARNRRVEFILRKPV